MKRVGNLYNKICDIDIIIDMYKIIEKNTKNKLKIKKFNQFFSCNIIDVKNIIVSKNYIPKEYNIFLIREPKLRIIMSQNIKDKIINHLVAKYFLQDVFEKTFIDTTVATRKGKGTDYGIKMIKKYLNEMKNKYNNFYYLKFDISKYFYNMDHSIMKKIIKHKIKDKDVLNIINSIIDSTDKEYINKRIIELKNNEIDKIKKLNINLNDKNNMINEVNSIPLYEKGKGFPIGNMTSQIFSLIYLNELCHFIKEKLKVKYFILYMDDGILFHKNKEYLKYCKKEIENILFKYNLSFNEKKTIIGNIKEGIDFLGFRYYINYNKILVKVRKQTKNKFKRKIKKLYKLVKEDKISQSYLYQVKSSYLGHLRYGSTKGLIYNVIKNIN